ncbi:MAG: hypothetical protein IBJ11_01770 [Phycisphaerales bacterium]|nr:hypothetical protein [Phycisphaerales bacterium]
MPDAAGQPSLLFTAFEPSGDDHAAAVIRELRRRHPRLPIFAWGGPKMARAGATIVKTTGDDAVVGVPTWDKIREHQQINRDIAGWLKANRITVHVPVDSPAANFPICRIAKRSGCKVVHLVAPQLWAWGPWRLRKLRRCTDLVLCLLPFEEDWFSTRGVPARFIGHPLFDEPLDLEALDEQARSLPGGAPKLALLPGSRPAELRRNFPLLLATFRELRRRHPGLVGVVGATTDAVAANLYERANALGGWPEGLDIRVGATDLVTRWCDVALVVSGTVTLQLAKQARPMVIVYKTNKLAYQCIGRWVITTKFFALPNLIAGREIVPELIPYFKGSGRLVDAADALLSSPEAQEAQRRALVEVIHKFAGKLASAEAADAIERMAGVVAGSAAPVRRVNEPKA